MANIFQVAPNIVTFGIVPEFGLEDSGGLLANSYSQQATVQKYEQPNSVSAPRGVIYYGQAMTSTLSGAVPATNGSGSSAVSQVFSQSTASSVEEAVGGDFQLYESPVPFLACVMTNANLDTSVLNPWLVDADEPTYTSYCEGANDSRNVGQPHNRDYSMSVYPF